MEIEELQKLADSFFEWPTSSRTYVTLTSALLFAQHVLRMTQQAGEKVYLVPTGQISESGFELHERHDAPVPMADFEVLYTAPQAQPALSVDDAIRMDREYIRGLKAGWNMGIVEDTEKLHAAINARLNEINAANKENTDEKG